MGRKRVKDWFFQAPISIILEIMVKDLIIMAAALPEVKFWAQWLSSSGSSSLSYYYQQ